MPLSTAERSRLYRQRMQEYIERYSNYLCKEHKRYEKKKEKGVIKLVNKMSEQEKRIVRRSWRKQKQIEREKKKMTAPVIGEFTNPPKPTELFPIRLRV